jgi:hypothetical protein
MSTPGEVPSYGSPSSPSYGKYGQGQALPPVPAPPPPDPSRPGWGQPGYVAPRRPADGPTHLQPVGGYLPAVIGLSMLMTVVTSLAVALAPNQHQQVRDVIDGVTTSRAGTSSGPYQLISSLSLLAQVGTWVTTSIWLTRVRQNALVLRPDGQRRSEIWIWIGWIVPFVNLWFPKQLVDDALAATASAVGRTPVRTGSWWATWIAISLLSIAQAVNNVLPENEARHGILAAVAIVVTALGLALWIRIVRRVSADQDALAADRPAASLQG